MFDLNKVIFLLCCVQMSEQVLIKYTEYTLFF